MNTLRVSYDGGQHATAVKEPYHNIVAIDCPFTGKGDEFSPASLLGISLASCMLLSMGAIAQRDHLDLRGAVADVRLTGLDKTVPHVDTINLEFNIPRDFSATDRKKLEMAAQLCPIMACIGAGTAVTATFSYTVANAA